MAPTKASFFTFWGKAKEGDDEHPCHLLPYHLLDAAAVARALASADARRTEALGATLELSRETFSALFELFAGLHDIGKFARGFQAKAPHAVTWVGGVPSRPSPVLHSDLGQLLWEHRLSPAIMEERVQSLPLPAGNKERRRFRRSLDGWAACATGHHGRPSASTVDHIPLVFSEHFDDETATAAESVVGELTRLVFQDSGVGVDLTPMGEEGFADRLRVASWSIAGWTVLADWLASGFFPYVSHPMSLDEYWRGHALPGAREAVRDAGIAAQAPSGPATTQELFAGVVRRPTAMQLASESADLAASPLLVVIEDATGSGKTEAALVVAQRLISSGRADGIYFALPTMATSNAMHGRMAGMYRRLYAPGASPSLVLAHSRRDAVLGYRSNVFGPLEGTPGQAPDTASVEAQCSAWVADRPKKALLAHVGVGTIDQALLGVLPVRHQTLRLLGLARKVLVVDELHAYDPYVLRLLEELIFFSAASGGSVVLLSATLPLRERDRMVRAFADACGTELQAPEGREYPSMLRATRNDITLQPVPASGTRTTTVNYLDSPEGAYATVLGASRAGQAACWIRNTVADAMDACDEIERRTGSKPLLFHSRFALADRLAIERKVVASFGPNGGPESRAGRILIATQVVEQSLDLDFDVMVSDLAPVDLLIQRAGRLHRHLRAANGARIPDGADGRAPPVLNVLGPPWTETPDAEWFQASFPRAERVYPDHGRLWLTGKALREAGSMEVPGGVRNLVEHVYDDGAVERIPVELRRVTEAAEGEEKAESSYAQLEVLSIRDGYWTHHQRFLEDVQARTRLGEPTRPLFLARWDGTNLRAWIGEGGNDDWDGSRVDLRQSVAHTAAQHPAGLEVQIIRVMQALPGKGVGSIVVPMVSVGEEVWEGRCVDSRGRNMRLRYHPSRGLETEPESVR